jgi:hypothetical protein
MMAGEVRRGSETRAGLNANLCLLVPVVMVKTGEIYAIAYQKGDLKRHKPGLPRQWLTIWLKSCQKSTFVFSQVALLSLVRWK